MYSSSRFLLVPDQVVFSLSPWQAGTDGGYSSIYSALEMARLTYENDVIVRGRGTEALCCN